MNELPQDISEIDAVMGDAGQDEPIFPINRVVAFAAPYVATLSGALASWCLVHVHFLSLFHLSSSQLATGLAQIITFVLVAGMTYASQHKWLDGWQKWEASVTDLQKAHILAEAAAPPVVPLKGHPDGTEYDEAAAKAELTRKIEAGEVPALKTP